MSYECPACHLVSHNPNDERERYCVRCHRFEHDSPVDSVVLRRLIEEVRVGDPPQSGYNRMHNRHNRGGGW